MSRDKYLRERDNINAWFNRPEYRKWKYLVFGDGIALILLMLATIVGMDSLSWRAVMIMRGCAGVLGIIFVVIGAIYCYVVYKDYIRHRFGQRGDK